MRMCSRVKGPKRTKEVELRHHEVLGWGHGAGKGHSWRRGNSSLKDQ